MKTSGIVTGFSLFMFLNCTGLFAQGANTSHTFPQMADGRQSDGSYYNSLIIVTNLNSAPTSCGITLFGLDASRFAAPLNFTVPAGTWVGLVSSGQQPLATGYSTVSCTLAVNAMLIYGLSTAQNTTAGQATVFSSPPSTYALFPVLMVGGAKFGVAIANNTATTANCSILFTTSSGQITGKTLQIPAKSNYSHFLDEIISVPAEVIGTLEITSGSQFSTIGLLFDGAVFTTVPATTR